MMDQEKIEKRRIREKRTISQMVCMYCDGHHKQQQTEVAHCGESICPECLELDAYAVLRTERCRQMHKKKNCEECLNHCYAPEMRRRIKEAMRYAGPRMIVKHPVAAVLHMVGK